MSKRLAALRLPWTFLIVFPALVAAPMVIGPVQQATGISDATYVEHSGGIAGGGMKLRLGQGLVTLANP